MEGNMASGDEFGSATLADVALAVGYATDDAERENAISAFVRRLPGRHVGIGHNQPPLSEVLDEELATHRARRDELVRVAETAVIVDEESASKVIDLIALCRAFETEIDDRRKELVKPYREAEKAINDRHNRLRLDVQVARQGTSGTGGLRGLLTAWDDRKKAAAEQDRQKAERLAKAKALAAEENRRKVEQAAGGKGAVAAELEALRAEEEAEHAAAQAESIRPEPTRGHMGQVSRKREIRFDITDPLAFASWLISQPGLQNNLRQALMTICGQHLRALGVEAVAAGVNIPGVTTRVEQGSAHVRR